MRTSARTWIASSRCCGPSPARTRSRDARREPTSHDALPADGAAFHFEFEPFHRRPRVVPGQPGARRAAAHDLVAEKRIEVAHGVDLRRRGVRPAETEYCKAALHFAEHVARLLAHRLGTAFAAPDGAFAVASTSLPGLGAARDHEARRGIGGGNGEREGVKARLRRRIDLGTHIAARDRIDLAIEQAPLLQGDHVAFVEGAKAL